MSAIEYLIKHHNSDHHGEAGSNFTTDSMRELSQLRAAASERDELKRTVEAQAARITWLTHDIGEDGLAAINRLISACERGDGIDQHAAPDISIARDEMVKQAAQLEQARKFLPMVLTQLSEDIATIGDDHSVGLCCCDVIALSDTVSEWLAAKAPQVMPTVCPECSSEVLPTKFCMMGHWCGPSRYPVIDTPQVTP